MWEHDDREPDGGPDLPDPAAAVTRTTIPPDAQRLGLDRNTEEGALLAMVGALNPSRPSHRIVAWVLLVALVLPLVLGTARQLF